MSAIEFPLPGDGTFPLMVVGESHHQEELEAIAGGRTMEGAERIVTARLILEDSNPYDRQAVRVEINRRHVGYLSRPDAEAHREYLRQAGSPFAIGTCRAQIRGGWDRGADDRGHFGVWLDFLLYER